jgi:Mn-dependent DtxR family transcriptional regulator
MKRLFFAAALAAAVPASAQFEGDIDAADIAAAVRSARGLARRLAAAAVSPVPVSALVSRLAKDGKPSRGDDDEIRLTLESETAPDAAGRHRRAEAYLVEIPAEDAEPAAESDVEPLVYRRYFNRIEATCADWSVDPASGAGSVDEWHFTVAPGGVLLAVDHTIVPVARGASGASAPEPDRMRSYRLPPSDPAARRRWESFARELLTLRPAVAV